MGIIYKVKDNHATIPRPKETWRGLGEIPHCLWEGKIEEISRMNFRQAGIGNIRDWVEEDFQMERKNIERDNRKGENFRVR